MNFKNPARLTALAALSLLFVIPVLSGAQSQSVHQDRNLNRGQARATAAPQAHAQREIVRTPTFVQRPRPTVPARNMPVQRFQPPQQINHPPVFNRPPVQLPVRQQPIYNVPLRRLPVYQAPVRQQPIYNTPLRRQPVYQAPIRQQPRYNAPVRQQPPTIQQQPKDIQLQRRPVTPQASYNRPPRKPRTPTAPVNLSQSIFTNTNYGRQYDNGVRLRKGKRVDSDWEKRYFRRGYCHFPYYRPVYTRNITYVSPFGFYYGVCAPYISSSVVNIYPPAVEFVDVPVYNGDNCVGFEDSGDQNFLNDPSLDSEEPGLANAIDQLRETFQDGDINALVALVDPNIDIAIYERGRYKYSMSGDNYLDLTRDAIKNAPTVQFSIDSVHQTSPTVFTASGRHVYRDPYENEQTVYVSFGLQDIGGQWTLTQVETAPARYRSLTP